MKMLERAGEIATSDDGLRISSPFLAIAAVAVTHRAITTPAGSQFRCDSTSVSGPGLVTLASIAAASPQSSLIALFNSASATLAALRPCSASICCRTLTTDVVARLNLVSTDSEIDATLFAMRRPHVGHFRADLIFSLDMFVSPAFLRKLRTD
jgi:hypothetical protein